MTSLLRKVLLFAGSIAVAATSNAQTTSTYTSGGKSISVDNFIAAGNTQHPSIVFFYGADGMSILPWSYNMIGSWFASQGYNFYIIHYFGSTNTTFADPITTVLNYNTWTQTAKDGVSWVLTQTNVNPKRVALMGMSLGSFLALSEASQDTRVAAVVEWYGGLINPAAVTMLPPTLIVHGADDPIVPVSEAYQLQSFLESKNIPYQMYIYPNEGHGFFIWDEIDALSKSLTFLQQHMVN